jgi:hypothetical protein
MQKEDAETASMLGCDGPSMCAVQWRLSVCAEQILLLVALRFPLHLSRILGQGNFSVGERNARDLALAIAQLLLHYCY